MREIFSMPFYDGKRYVELAGLSTETKPEADIAAGSWFHEVDTGKVLAFNEADAEWVEQIEFDVPSDSKSVRSAPVVDAGLRKTAPLELVEDEPAEEPAEEPTEDPAEEESGNEER